MLAARSFFLKKSRIPLHPASRIVKFDSVQQPQNQKNAQEKNRKENDQEETGKISQTKEVR
jgi:hypothetical protein